jgi:hypothetical protein
MNEIIGELREDKTNEIAAFFIQLNQRRCFFQAKICWVVLRAHRRYASVIACLVSPQRTPWLKVAISNVGICQHYKVLS